MTLRVRKGVPPLIRGAPSAVHGWKIRFLFISCTSREDWGFVDWREPQENLLKNPLLGPCLKQDLDTLHGFEIPELRELLSEQILFNVGISQFNSMGMYLLFVLINPSNFKSDINRLMLWISRNDRDPLKTLVPMGHKKKKNRYS